MVINSFNRFIYYNKIVESKKIKERSTPRFIELPAIRPL